MPQKILRGYPPLTYPFTLTHIHLPTPPHKLPAARKTAYLFAL